MNKNLNNLNIFKGLNFGINDISAQLNALQSSINPMQDLMSTLQLQNEALTFVKILEPPFQIMPDISDMYKNASDIHNLNIAEVFFQDQPLRDFTESMHSLHGDALSSFNSMIKSLDLSWINNTILKEIALNTEAYKKIKTLSESFKAEIHKYDFKEFDILDEEDIVEFNNGLRQINGNWQQNLFKKINEFKEKYPVYAFLLVSLLLYFLNTCYDSVATVTKNAILREAPNTQSSKIYNTHEEQQVNIINNFPYYYEIEFFDEASKTSKTGWVSKRNVKIINNMERE